MLLAVVSVLDGGPQDEGRTFTNAVAAIQKAELELNRTFLRLDAHPGGLTAAVGAIVQMAGRLHVIQDTKYLSAGYALVDGMVTLVFVLMTVSDWPADSLPSLREGAAYTVVIGYLYSFLRLLIGDLEDPFAYPENFCLRCLDEGRVVPPGSGNANDSVGWSNVAAEFRYGGAIQGMTILTVTFGTQLRGLMAAADPRALEDGKDNAENMPGISAAERIAAWLQVGPQTNQESAGTGVKERAARQARHSAIKWRLALRSLPVVVGLVLCRLWVWYGAGTGGWIDAPDVESVTVGGTPKLFTTFVSLVVFVCTVATQGLLQDYKESERMPSELVAGLYGLTRAVRLQHIVQSTRPVKDGKPPVVRQEHRLNAEEGSEPGALILVERTLLAVLKVLEMPMPGKGFEGLTVAAMEEVDAADAEISHLVRLSEGILEEGNIRGFKVMPPDKHLEAVRSVMARACVIKSTSYILEAYTLMDLMVLWIFGILTSTDWPVQGVAPVAAGFTVAIPFLFTYLEWFVRSLENPFEYPPGHLQESYAHKERAPLTLVQGHRFGGSIDMSPVTVCFGRVLGRLIEDVPQPWRGRFQAADSHLGSGDLRVVVARSSQPEPNGYCCLGCEGGLVVYFLRRTRLVIQTLPFIVVMVGLRLLVWYGGGLGGWIDPGVPLNFVGLAIFVTSFLLQGVIQDYREGERLPCLAAVALQGLSAVCAAGCRDGGFDEKFGESKAEKVKGMNQRLFREVVLALLDQEDITINSNTLKSDISYVKCEKFFDKLFYDLVVEFSTKKDNGSNKISDVGWDLFGVVGDLRRKLGRARSIKQTSYTLDGYTLMDAVLLAVCTLLTLADWPREVRFGSAMGTTIVVSGLFAYMALLIRSLENPFKYPRHSDSMVRTGDKTSTDGSGDEKTVGHCQLAAAEATRLSSICDSDSSAVTGGAVEETVSLPRVFTGALRGPYDFSCFQALDFGTPIDPSILTHVLAPQLHRRRATAQRSPFILPDERGSPASQELPVRPLMPERLPLWLPVRLESATMPASITQVAPARPTTDASPVQESSLEPQGAPSPWTGPWSGISWLALERGLLVYPVPAARPDPSGLCGST